VLDLDLNLNLILNLDLNLNLSMTSAITFQNISKQYRLGLVSTRTLSHDLNRWWKVNVMRKEDPYLKIGETNDRATKGGSEYVWALKDINFEVQQGEVLGIIGKNGAGKSTLLKILSRVTTPTTGIIKAHGRIASLLEVGTGFHPEMTGRENIYMNGCIMGMSKAEINRKFDEIVDFAGVERYIDTPTKRYSSGMTVRLGFAVAAFLEPEILVVDEVLAVGDAEFQKKAIGKMQDVSKNEGRTVLFVSHNMGAVRNLCNTGVLLEYGKVKANGKINNVIDQYLTQKTNQEQVYIPEDNIVLEYKSDSPIKQPNFGFVVYDNHENPIFGTNPIQNGILNFGEPKTKGTVSVTVTSPYLADGIYPVSIWFHDGLAYGNHIFYKEKCISLEIENMNNSHIEKNPALVGHVIPICNWKFN